jgi:hypothetical protein
MLDEIIHIPVAETTTPLEGQLRLPSNKAGLCLFVHGSGSSRFSPRYLADIYIIYNTIILISNECIEIGK